MITTGNAIDGAIRQLDTIKLEIASIEQTSGSVFASTFGVTPMSIRLRGIQAALKQATATLLAIRSQNVDAPPTSALETINAGLESPRDCDDPACPAAAALVQLRDADRATCTQVAAYDADDLGYEIRSATDSVRATGSADAIADRLRIIADAVASGPRVGARPPQEVVDAMISVAEQAQTLSNDLVLAAIEAPFRYLGLVSVELLTEPSKAEPTSAAWRAERVPLVWRHQVQIISQIQAQVGGRLRGLMFAAQTAGDGRVGVIALEADIAPGGLSEEAIGAVLDAHAHDTLGLFDGYLEAFEAAEKYAARWVNGEPAEKCPCGPIANPRSR